MTRLLRMMLIFALVISIHEAGHYLAALACGVTVEEVSIGIGHALWSTPLPDGSVFNLRLIPLGGFVRLAAEGPGSLEAASYWQHMAVSVSGMFVSITAAFLYFVFFRSTAVPEKIEQLAIGRRSKNFLSALYFTYGLWLVTPVYAVWCLVTLKVGILREFYGPIAIIFMKSPSEPAERTGDQKSSDQVSSGTDDAGVAAYGESPEPERSEISKPLWEFMDDVMLFCVGLSVFNMIPIAPFDGGVMLVHTVSELFGPGWPVTFVTVFGFIMFAALIIYITVQDIVRVWVSRSK